MAESKDFYFKLFAREYLTDGDLRYIPMAAQGIVVRLWCVCCLDGAMPGDLEMLSLASGVQQTLLQTYQREWQQFFSEGPDGRLFSRRMESEREARLRVKSSTTNAGKASAAKRKLLASQRDVGTNVGTDVGTDVPTVKSQSKRKEKSPAQEKIDKEMMEHVDEVGVGFSADSSVEFLCQSWIPVGEAYLDPDTEPFSDGLEPLDEAMSSFSAEDQQRLSLAGANIADCRNLAALMQATDGTLEFVGNGPEGPPDAGSGHPHAVMARNRQRGLNGTAKPQHGAM